MAGKRGFTKQAKFRKKKYYVNVSREDIEKKKVREIIDFKLLEDELIKKGQIPPRTDKTYPHHFPEDFDLTPLYNFLK